MALADLYETDAVSGAGKGGTCRRLTERNVGVIINRNVKN